MDYVQKKCVYDKWSQKWSKSKVIWKKKKKTGKKLWHVWINFMQHLSISSLHLAYIRISFWNTHFFNTNLPGMYRYIHPLLYPTPTKFFFFFFGGGEGYWFHSVRPSVCPSVRPSRIPCPLCSAFSSGWIHFICIHLIKQLQKVCRVQSFWQNCKFLIFDNFLKFVTLTLSSFDLRCDVNH